MRNASPAGSEKRRTNECPRVTGVHAKPSLVLEKDERPIPAHDVRKARKDLCLNIVRFDMAEKKDIGSEKMAIEAVVGEASVELETAVAIGKRLSTTARTIQRMFREGLIPGYRVSRKLIRFRWREVEEALSRLRIPARSENQVRV